MVDDNKHQQRIPVNLTDREYLDACEMADRLDKKTSELMRYALRLYLYGTVGLANRDGNDSHSSHEVR